MFLDGKSLEYRFQGQWLLVKGGSHTNAPMTVVTGQNGKADFVLCPTVTSPVRPWKVF